MAGGDEIQGCGTGTGCHKGTELKLRAQFSWSDEARSERGRIRGKNSLLSHPISITPASFSRHMAERHMSKARCSVPLSLNVPSEVCASFTTCSAKAMSSMVPLMYCADAAPSSRHRSTTCHTNSVHQKRLPCPREPGVVAKEGVCVPWDVIWSVGSFKGSLKTDSFGECVTQGSLALWVVELHVCRVSGSLYITAME